MKKTRILASLLCIMMVACLFPVMQVSAAPASANPANLTTAIGGVLGTNGAQFVTSNSVWGVCDLDFTEAGVANTTGLTVGEGITFDETNGAMFPDGESVTLDYTNVAGNSDEVANVGWGPFCTSNYFAFGFKLGTNGIMTIRGEDVYRGNEMFIQVRPADALYGEETIHAVQVTATTAESDSDNNYIVENEANYQPGTGWNDVLVVRTTADGYRGYTVYMKQASATSFTKVAFAPYFRAGGGAWASGSLTFTGHDAAVDYAANVTGTSASTYNTIEDIMGGQITTTYDLTFDSNFDATTYIETNTASFSTNATLTSEGYDLSGGALTFTASKGDWSALNGNLITDGESAYVPQAVYYKLKHGTGGSCVVTGAVPSGAGRIYAQSTVGTAIGMNGAAGTLLLNNIKPVADVWEEHLLVPDASSWSGGYDRYIKSDALTGGVWYKVTDATGYRDSTSTSYATAVLNFNSSNYILQSIKTYRLGTTDANTIPANTMRYTGTEFDEAPASNYNYSATYGSIANGYLSIPSTTESGNLKLTIYDGAIPVGGYADIKSANNSSKVYEFYDGAKYLQLVMYGDYIYVGADRSKHYVGTPNNKDREYRVLNSENGYTLYTRIAGDLAWQLISTNVYAESTGEAKMILAERKHKNAASGVSATGRIDYVRFYGPVPAENSMILLDGHTTNALTEGETVGYGSTFHPIVNPNAGKLLIATYKGNDMVKAHIYNTADVGSDTYVSLVDGSDNVKVFLWDSLTSLNSLTPVVSLER